MTNFIRKIIVYYIDFVDFKISENYKNRYREIFLLILFTCIAFPKYEWVIIFIYLIPFTTYWIFIAIYKAFNSISWFIFMLLFGNTIITSITLTTFYQFSYITTFILLCILWVFISVIADTKVSILSNGLLASIFGLIFTLLSFILSFTNKEVLTLFLNSLSVQDYTSIQHILNFKYFGYTTIDLIKFIPVLCLPYIGLSTISLSICQIKKYLMEKKSKQEILIKTKKEKVLYKHLFIIIKKYWKNILSTIVFFGILIIYNILFKKT